MLERIKSFKAIAAAGLMGTLLLSGCGSESTNGDAGSSDKEKEESFNIGVT